jgi:hypothetical protein
MISTDIPYPQRANTHTPENVVPPLAQLQVYQSTSTTSARAGKPEARPPGYTPQLQLRTTCWNIRILKNHNLCLFFFDHQPSFVHAIGIEGTLFNRPTDVTQQFIGHLMDKTFLANPVVLE